MDLNEDNPEESCESSSDSTQRSGPAQLRRRAEERVRALEAQASENLSPEELRRLLHELRVHQITQQKQAEEALQESEERFRSTFEKAPVGMVITAPDGRFLRVNNVFCRMLGYTADELVRKTFLQVTYPDDQAASVEWVRKLLAALPTATMLEKRYLNKAGQAVWGCVSACLIRKNDGSPDYFVTHIQDITERKQAEQALRESETKFKALFEQAGDYALVLDPDGKNELEIVEVNESACLAHGFSREELIGKSVLELDASRLSRPQVVEMVQRVLTGQTLHFETVHRRKDGTAFPVDVIAKAVQFGGNQRLIFSVERDITERKRAEEALRESEKRFRSIIEKTDAGYFLIDRSGFFQAVNRAWLRMHGYDSAEEVIGKHFALTQVEMDMEREQAIVEKLLDGDSIPTGEFSRRCKNGAIGYHHFAAQPAMRGGEVVGLEGFLIDTTEHKQMEAALRESETKFRMLFETMSEGMVLHEIIWEAPEGRSLDYRILECNPAFERQTGLSAELARGQLASIFYRTSPAPFLDTYAEVVRTGQSRTFETFFPPLKRHFSVSAFIPKPGWFATVFLDITEQKQAEIKLQEQIEELRRWYNVTLGREQRMMELKRQVNELRKRLGEPIAYPSQEKDEG